MDALARRFVVASVAWLLMGTGLGMVMAVPGWQRALTPPGGRLLPVHAHVQLYGFVTMMIFGVALHILPRFEGRPLPWPRLAHIQWVLANAGLASFGLGHAVARPALVVFGGSLMAAAAAAFGVQVLGLYRHTTPNRAQR